MNTDKKQKIITVVGPTSSGKSDVAVLIARKINGEIISADSRQVYKGMDIGTGKITKKEMSGIPHHLLNVINPKKVFTVSEFKKQAEDAINKIIKKGKVPIICGGTGLYVGAVIDDLELPNVPPNKKLRDELGKKTKEELFNLLKKIDKRRASEIDRNNPIRVIRAIEIARAVGKVPKLKRNSDKFELLEIGLYPKKELLLEKIRMRIIQMIKDGMINEVKRLKKGGVSWKRLEEFGLEYRYVSRYLRGYITKKEMIEKLSSETNKYAKRQMTWFNADKRINWFNPSDIEKIINLVEKFVN